MGVRVLPRSLFTVMKGVQGMAVGSQRMMARGVMLARLMQRVGFPVVFRRIFMVHCRFFVMSEVNILLSHDGLLVTDVSRANRLLSSTSISRSLVPTTGQVLYGRQVEAVCAVNHIGPSATSPFRNVAHTSGRGACLCACVQTAQTFQPTLQHAHYFSSCGGQP